MKKRYTNTGESVLVLPNGKRVEPGAAFTATLSPSLERRWRHARSIGKGSSVRKKRNG